MNRITKLAATAGATLAVAGLGLAATAAPASAAGRGSANVAEARKVVREADRQHCLTLKEARKIVHGNGTEYTVEGPTRGWQWKGTGNVRTLNATFVHGCADFVYLDYRHGRTLVWSNWTVGLGSSESW